MFDIHFIYTSNDFLFAFVQNLKSPFGRVKVRSIFSSILDAFLICYLAFLLDRKLLNFGSFLRNFLSKFEFCDGTFIEFTNTALEIFICKGLYTLHFLIALFFFLIHCLPAQKMQLNFSLKNLFQVLFLRRKVFFI